MRPTSERADWDLSPREAAQRQRELAGQVVTTDRFSAIRRIAGIDAGFPDDGQTTRVAIVVMSYLRERAIRRRLSAPIMLGAMT